MPRRKVNINSVAWRTGAINPNGGRAFVNATKVYNFRTLGRLECSDQSALLHVNQHYFPVTCLNDPMSSVASTNQFVREQVKDADRRPTFHETAVNENYEVYEVLSAEYLINVQVQSDDKNDVILAWCFQRPASDASTNGLVPLNSFTANADTDTVTEKNDLWYSVRNNGGWGYARFSGVNSGGSPYPSQGTVRIPIPSVRKLGNAIWAQYTDGTTDLGNEVLDNHDKAYKGALASASSATNGELGRYFLCIYMFKAGPGDSDQVFSNDKILLEIEINQKAKLWRNTVGSAKVGTLFHQAGLHA